MFSFVRKKGTLIKIKISAYILSFSFQFANKRVSHFEGFFLNQKNLLGKTAGNVSKRIVPLGYISSKSWW